MPEVLTSVFMCDQDLNHLAASVGLIMIAVIILCEKMPFEKLGVWCYRPLIGVLVAVLEWEQDSVRTCVA